MLANISPTFDRSARLFRQQFLFKVLKSLLVAAIVDGSAIKLATCAVLGLPVTFTLLYYGSFLSNVPTSIDNLCANFPSQSLASRFLSYGRLAQ